MLNHKSYMDIQRMKDNFFSCFDVSDHIVIQEKIDGANASFQYDSSDNCIVAFSRKQTLGLSNNLRGFWEWTQTLNVESVKNILGDNLRVFCEWLVPHTVKYPQDKYQKCYCYDVYDTQTQAYLPQDKVKEIISKLNLIYVPALYDGEFTTWDNCISLVGKTELGGDYGEGIVIKNQTKLNNPNTRNPFYVKIVGEKFQETKGSKEIKVIDPEKMKSIEDNKALCATIVTEARVRKLIHKMVDEQILPEDWTEKQMGIIAKNISRMVYDDCLKEEPEIVKMIENFGKVANQVSMAIARNIVNNQ